MSITAHNIEQKRNLSINRPPNNRFGFLASLGVGASVLIGKTKYVFAALKLTKAAPLASMLLTSFAYSYVFGWPYALGMVGQIFCHECGHMLVMLHYKIPFSPMVFIPFVGAAIVQGEERNAYEDAMVAFGGPAAGTAVACAVAVAGSMTESQLLLALADFGYMINLFNLMPVGMLDGGRIGNAISPWFNVLGLAGGGWLIYTGAIANPIFYLIMLGGTYTAGSRLLGFEERGKNYYNVPPLKQGAILSAYLGLVGFLLYGMSENNKNRLTPKQIQTQQQYGEQEFKIYSNNKDKDGNLYDDYFSDTFDKDDD